MAVSTMTNDGLKHVAIHGSCKGKKALICGCGPSLATVVIPDDRYKIVINDGYKTVKPDIWVALDQPCAFDVQVFEGAYTKILRSKYVNYISNECTGKPLNSYPLTYFADMADRDLSHMFEPPHDDYIFVWKRQTTIFAVQLAWYLGFTDIAFAGIDLKVGRHVPKVYTPKMIQHDTAVWEQQEQFFKWWIPEAQRRGIKISSLTGGIIADLTTP